MIEANFTTATDLHFQMEPLNALADAGDGTFLHAEGDKR